MDRKYFTDRKEIADGHAERNPDTMKLSFIIDFIGFVTARVPAFIIQ